LIARQKARALAGLTATWYVAISLLGLDEIERRRMMHAGLLPGN
jgi:hypothetical protein